MTDEGFRSALTNTAYQHCMLSAFLPVSVCSLAFS